MRRRMLVLGRLARECNCGPEVCEDHDLCRNLDVGVLDFGSSCTYDQNQATRIPELMSRRDLRPLL